MKYRVIITQNAKSNLLHYCLHAALHAPLAAADWLDRFEQALGSLSSNPQRCSLASENDAVLEEIRQFLFGKRSGAFRALFSIEGEQVRVLHIRRATMDTATPEELYG